MKKGSGKANKGKSSGKKQKAMKAMKAGRARVKQRKTRNPKAFYKQFKLVIEMDESLLNKNKPGALMTAARPQKDQVWVWGATVPKMPTRFYLKVLDHPADVPDGKPRGKTEILRSLRLLDIPKKSLIVSDCWKGTIAAIKAFRREMNWTEMDLWHEVVNHSAGEIRNVNSFTTNHIENRWSIVKRWVRKAFGGRMPSHSDRHKWVRLLKEFIWRKHHSEGNSLDFGNTRTLR